MKVVVVGFKVEQEDSVVYHKDTIVSDNPEFIADGVQKILGGRLARCYEKGCDFVSVRFIRD